MKMILHRWQLPLAHPFTISRGTITTQESLVVELVQDGKHGYGEVTTNDFYGHTYESMEASLGRLGRTLDRYAQSMPETQWETMLAELGNDMFAMSALDMAAHDLHGKLTGLPTWRRWGLQWENVPQSSYTIGIDTIDKMLAKLSERPDWGIYKIKLGTDNDLEIIEALRSHTAATFRVDANCGWTAEQTIANSHRLAELGVEFIEQPLPPEASSEDKRRVYLQSALPIIADEDCQVAGDVEQCYRRYHGVNVKICKCGGLTPALRMLRQARSLKLKTMVGCMVESAIGISGAAHLLPLLDYADLDGAVLLADAPATGVVVENGLVQLTELAGNGGSLLKSRLAEFKG